MPVFPPQLAGWNLQKSETKLPSQAPKEVGRFKVLAYERVVYTAGGNAIVTAEVFQLESSAAGLELEQTWKPSADTVAIHKGTFFAVIHWESADREKVTQFVRDLGNLLSGTNES